MLPCFTLSLLALLLWHQGQSFFFCGNCALKLAASLSQAGSRPKTAGLKLDLLPHELGMRDERSVVLG